MSLTYKIIPVLLFFIMIIFPDAVFEGARDGILLWSGTVFPTLFPFMVVSGMMISCGGLYVISKIFGKMFSLLFATSGNGAFAVLTGFLCGYPMGARTAADLARSGKITKDEGAYLLSFCNNTSPGFVMNYIVLNIFEKKSILLPTLLIMNIVPVLLSVVFRKIYLKGQKRFPDIGNKAADHSDSSGISWFAAFDSCLTDSFDAILKVGLYITVFSVLISVAAETAPSCVPLHVLLPFLEVTNGARMIRDLFQETGFCYSFILGLASFGGICAAAQTKAMIRESGLPFLPYIAQKLAAAAAASILGYLYIIHI